MSISTMNDDLNILQNLAIPAFEEDVDVIQKLDDEPNDVGGLTAAELKAKFDEAGNRIKTYLNETLVPSISETVAEAEERAEAEAARVLAEEQRVTAEQARVAAEAEREQAEAERRAGETDRAAAEAARKTAEDARVLAEQNRVDTDNGIVAQATSAAEAAENAANKAASAAIHQPIVGDNGNWHTWSFDAGAYVDTGIYAGGDAPYIGENGNWYVGQTDTGVSATSTGVYVGSGDMPEGFHLQIDPEGEETDFIPHIGSNGHWFIGNTDLNVSAIGPTGPVGEKGDMGPAGPAGSDGQDGADGKSAYQYAVDGGYTGTEEAFAAKLAAEIPTVDDTLTQSGQAADAAAVGEQLSNLSEEKVNKSALGLIVGADGKIYVAINGVAVGNGVEITGETVEDTTYKVELSDGITLNTLMFQDEFEGDALSSTWKPAYGYDNAALNNWWTADKKNLGVSDGCVRMTMLRDNPTDDFAISAAKIETMQYGAANNYGFDTGYCEVRFKLDKVGAGIWPAIWCVGQTQTDEYTDITATSVTRKIHGYTWPRAGEINQLDGIGSAFTPGLIYQTDPYDSGLLTMKGSQNVSLEADTWYTIGVYKTKDVIKVYWNRELIDTFDISAINSFSGMGERLIINLSTGKSLGGILPDDVSEVNMFVDYVRVYSLSNGYTTLAEQNTATLLPDYADGFACVSDRKFLLRPQFAENTKNTALHWASSDTAVAKVENGYVTTVADGKCAISATDVNGNQVISFPLTVKADAGVLATDIKIVSDMTSVGVNESVEIEALIYPTNCDSLTPTLTILSESEYCTVDGSTVHNNNDSGQDQTVTLRVGTNNPVVYEDLEITLKTNINYTVSITNGLVNDYQAKAKYINTDDTLNLKWTDAVSSVVLNYFQSNASFDGVKLVKTSTIDVLKNVYMTSFLDGVTAGTFVSAVSNLAAGSSWGYVLSSEDEENGTKTGHYTSVYFSSATNARIRQMPEDGNNTAVWQKNIGFTQNDFLVLVGRVDSGTIEYALYNSGGLIGTTGQQTITEVVGDDMTIGAAYVGSSTRGNGIKGNIHQHLVYNRALSDEEIATIAAELVEMHAGNV